jgi:GNAT superfamily N-acetyltransferase
VTYEALDAAALAVNARWWEIYEECFPFAPERERPAAIIESVRSGAGAVLHAHEGGETIGLVRTHVLSDREDFLAYIGVTESHRRHGVAEMLFRALPRKDVLFEVEDPAHAAFYGGTADRCEARIAWYRQHFGATPLELSYLQPPLIAGTAPFPLRLMWTGPPLTHARTLEIVWRLYDRFYHQANGVPLAQVEDCYAQIQGGL